MTCWLVNGAYLTPRTRSTAFAYPAIRGFGRSKATPSRLPNNYATGLLTTLAFVWGVLAVVAVVGLWRRQRQRT